MINFSLAAIAQSAAMCRLYEACKTDLINRNIFQWGDWGNNYPGKVHIDGAIMRNESHVLKVNDEIIGAVILNEQQSEEWRTLPWSESGGKVLVIHALVIDPRCQNQGYGKKLLSYCEQYAKGHHYKSIRLDAFIKNDASNRLYIGFGYKNVGIVRFDSKPEGNKDYYCYEKGL
jgi:ribosomal protein S18 acetylase RimI-like enzyme